MGVGVDLSFKLTPTLFVRGGVGYYEAKARRVEFDVGRDYELSDGQGYHFSLEKRFKFNDYFAWSVFSSYRLITYSSVKMENASGSYIPLTQKWRQKIFTVGIGLHFEIPEILDDRALGKK